MVQASQAESDHEYGVGSEARLMGVDRREHLPSPTIDRAGKLGSATKANAARLARAGAVGKPNTKLARSPGYRKARHTAAVAPRGFSAVLEEKVTSKDGQATNSARGDSLDRGNGSQELHLAGTKH